MHDPRTFEARLRLALGRYADHVPTDVDAVAFVRATRHAPAPVRSIWGPSRTLRLALVLGLVSALAVAAAFLVGGRPSPSPTPIGITNGWIAYATEPGRITSDARSHDAWSDIHIVRVGSEPHLLVGGDGTRNVCPSFSADGKQLAFGEGSGPSSATLEREHRAIVIMAIDSDGPIVDPALRLPIAGAGHVPCPVWSPDGQKLAYPNGHEIAIVSLDGTSSVIPDWDEGPVNPFPLAFAWSPDGLTIAAAGRSGTWVLPVDGSSPRLLDPAYSTFVSWSPDGAWIGVVELVFKERCADDRRGRCRSRYPNPLPDHTQARLLAADGQGATVDLDPGTGGQFGSPGTGGPLWSPSGDRLVYRTDGGLVVADRDGSDPTRLSTSYPGGIVAWSPDGRSLLLKSDSDAPSWDLLSMHVGDEGGLVTVVHDIPVSGTRSFPGLGDITWQSVSR
jgi:Tol biopolymer transport system component